MFSICGYKYRHCTGWIHYLCTYVSNYIVRTRIRNNALNKCVTPLNGTDKDKALDLRWGRSLPNKVSRVLSSQTFL